MNLWIEALFSLVMCNVALDVFLYTVRAQRGDKFEFGTLNTFAYTACAGVFLAHLLQ